VETAGAGWAVVEVAGLEAVAKMGSEGAKETGWVADWGLG